MTEISFTGSIGYITYLVEKYEKEGYEIKSYIQKNNVKFGPLVEVTMTKKQINPGDIVIYVNGKPVSCTTEKNYDLTVQRTWAPNELETIQRINKEFTKDNFRDQLQEALEREDYETAAILRDKIKEL
jgi:hypothetical protein